MTKTANRQHDEFWVDPAEIFVANPEPGHDIGSVIFNEDIGFSHQGIDQRLSRWMP